MKHLFALTIFTLNIITFSHAQTLGCRVGLNFSSVTGETEFLGNTKAMVGYHVGPTIDFKVNSFFSVESGILFSTQGYRTDIDETGIEGRYTFEQSTRLNYLQIPITAKMEHETPLMTIFGAVGPYVSIGLSGKIKTTVGFEDNITTAEQDVVFDKQDGDFNPLDMGMTLAGGIQMNNIQIGLSYNQGFTRIVPETQGFKLANQVFSIFAVYTLELN